MRKGKTGAGMREGTEKALDCASCCSSRAGEFQRRVVELHLTETRQIQVEEFWPKGRRRETGVIWLLQPALDQESDFTTTSAL